MNRFSFYALVVFSFSLPWQDFVRLPISSTLSVSRLAGLLLIVAAVVATFRRGSVRLRVPALSIILTGMFCVWAAIGSVGNLWSPNGGFLKAITYFQLAVMALIVWQLCRTKDDHLALLQAFVLGAYVLAGRIAFEYLTNPFVPTSTQSIERYTGFGDDPNGVAALMALALPMAWFLGVFRTRGLWRWVNYLYLPLAIFSIILTGSRGGFVVALTGLLVVLLTLKYLRPAGRVAVVVGAVIVGGVILTFVPIGNFSRIAETSAEVSGGNVSNRSQIWAAGFELYRQSPIVGIGTGTFPHAVEPVLGYSMAAHNAFLNVLVELGVIGFVLFVLNFVVVLLPLLRLSGPDRLFYVCLWLALVVSMLPSNVEDAQYVWALLTLLATRQAYTVRLPGLSAPADAGHDAPGSGGASGSYGVR